jgi:hypothetical protein
MASTVREEAMEDDNRSPIIVEVPGWAQGFTQIPNVILRCCDISDGAKIVLGVILSYAWTGTKSFPGREKLAADTGHTVKTVTKYTQELQTSGLLEIQRRGQGKTNLYVIKPIPPEISKHP